MKPSGMAAAGQRPGASLPTQRTPLFSSPWRQCVPPLIIVHSQTPASINVDRSAKRSHAAMWTGRTANTHADRHRASLLGALPDSAFNALLSEPIQARTPIAPDKDLINNDFAPTLPGARTWDVADFASFWITLVISIPSWLLAASLMDLGMSWIQGIMTVLIGNIITLVPMVLNAHPGTKYGIPFPVLARASFGIKGSNLPSILRALVACGWFGIQTWIGGSSILQLLSTLSGGALASSASTILPVLGISPPELMCFLAFWSLQVWIVLKGMESIRVLEKYSAPILVALSTALLGWALMAAGGFGPMLAAPSQYAAGMPKAGQFWGIFWPAVTANVGFWGTLSLNIPDFTRYARSQKDQILGQAIGLPFFMALFAFIGLAVTSATVVIYGAPVVDPVALLGKMEGVVPICLSLFGLMWATLTTNIAANIVAPANAFVNISPSRISFALGSLVTALIGFLIMPWKLLSSSQGFVNTWLVGYSALLGPIIGVIMADYWIVRKRVIDVDALYSYSTKAPYWYQNGWNPAALVALLAGVLPTVPGFLHTVNILTHVHPLLKMVYDLSWFVGVAISAALYVVLMQQQRGAESASQPGADGPNTPKLA